MAKEFRFGIGRNAKSQSSIQEFARRVEGFGYDVLHVPDHLGMAAPFPTLTMAAYSGPTTIAATIRIWELVRMPTAPMTPAMVRKR